MHQYYDESAVHKPAHSVYLDADSHTTLLEEAPEPIKNVFDGGDEAAQEEKTQGLGPNNEVKMQESTAAAGPAPVPVDKDAPVPADDRAPVGLDAGALEVTGAAHDEGGWHGGANEAAPKDEAKAAEAPVGAKVAVPEMDLDDDAKRLADAALRQADE
jgi:dolichyl-phosphate-mannose-protein mannosyltransferase